MTKPTQPEVSILLPVYNAAETVEEAVRTLLHQAYASFEIIAVNDGSQDDSASILDRLGQLDSRMCPHHIDHVGLIGALNHGIEACTGQYVARFDADDRAHPDRLAKQVAYLDAHQDIAAVGSQVHCFPDEHVAEGFRVYESWINSLISSEDIAREIYIESPLVHPTVTIRREKLIEIGGYEEHGWPEDYDLWLRLHTAGERFAKIPEVLHEWREGDDRLTRTDSRYSVENFIRAKVHYLMKGPLKDRRQIVVWGAGQMGRRISKHFLREGAEILAFVDIDPKKIGNTRRGSPIISPDDLPGVVSGGDNPCVLAAVPSRGARALIRENLNGLGWVEGSEYICVA
jgi:glycosyltransferase involved in cell wall biosynthesis